MHGGDRPVPHRHGHCSAKTAHGLRLWVLDAKNIQWLFPSRFVSFRGVRKTKATARASGVLHLAEFGLFDIGWTGVSFPSFGPAKGAFPRAAKTQPGKASLAQSVARGKYEAVWMKFNPNVWAGLSEATKLGLMRFLHESDFSRSTLFTDLSQFTSDFEELLSPYHFEDLGRFLDELGKNIHPQVREASVPLRRRVSAWGAKVRAREGRDSCATLPSVLQTVIWR